MNLADYTYQSLLLPPCLRNEDALVTNTNLGSCVQGSITYYIGLLLLAVTIISFVYIVYAGIQMATGFGNESKYAAGKNTLLHAVIGLIVASLAYSIVAFTTGFFGAKRLDSGTGVEFVNDPAKVTSHVAVKEITGPPANGEELTGPERTEAEAGSATGDSLPLKGTNLAMILMINDEPFSASFDGQSLNVHYDAATKKYWVKAWNDVANMKGKKLVISQGQNERTITLR